MIPNIHTLLSEALPPYASDLCRTLNNHGYEAYIIGGAVRDALLGIDVKDIDITTNARPEEVESIFPKTLPTGKAFGTITVQSTHEDDTFDVQVTTYRQDGTYTNQRHPDEVVYETSLSKDLSRRDFTINALAFNPHTSEFIDQFNGVDHLHSKQLVVIGDPIKRFEEDSLRLFRCCRFVSQLNASISSSLQETLTFISPTIQLPSHERIYIELKKLVHSPNASKGLELMKHCGLGQRLDPLFNELSMDVINDIDTLDMPLRWAHLISHLSANHFLEILPFPKKEQHFIKKLIHYNGDIQKAMFTIHQLALSGKDIQEMGYVGENIGDVQRWLFNQVIHDFSLNTKASLKQLINEQYG